MSAHRHEWSALYAHFGWYRDKDSHYHVCLVDGCEAWLIGKGRGCNNARRSHVIEIDTTTAAAAPAGGETTT